MAYSNIEELPSEVRNSFDTDDMKVWMDEYNRLAKDNDVWTAYKGAWHACMTLPSSFSFKTMATVEDVDSDGELITLDTVIQNLNSYLREGGKVQQAHSNYQIATIWDYEMTPCPTTGKPGVAVYGNVFGGRGDNIEYARAREDFIKGQNSLSVGGDASVEGYECTDEQCYVRRNMQELMEISLCEVPANPYAKLIWYNDKAIVKSKGESTLKVESVDVHKSYNECSYEHVRKLLSKNTSIPFGSKVTINGLFVTTKDEGGLMSVMDSLRLRYDYDLKKGGFVVRSIEDEMERVFKKGMKEGWLTKERDEYRIGDGVPAPYFMMMLERGYAVKSIGGGYVLNGEVLKEGGAMSASNAGANGAMNSRYSSDGSKAYLTFEEIMDWKSRLMKETIQKMPMEGYTEIPLAEVRRIIREEIKESMDPWYAERGESGISFSITYADGKHISCGFDEFVDPKEISLQNIVEFTYITEYGDEAYHYERR